MADGFDISGINLPDEATVRKALAREQAKLNNALTKKAADAALSNVQRLQGVLGQIARARAIVPWPSGTPRWQEALGKFGRAIPPSGGPIPTGPERFLPAVIPPERFLPAVIPKVAEAAGAAAPTAAKLGLRGLATSGAGLIGGPAGIALTAALGAAGMQGQAAPSNVLEDIWSKLGSFVPAGSPAAGLGKALEPFGPGALGERAFEAVSSPFRPRAEITGPTAGPGTRPSALYAEDDWNLGTFLPRLGTELATRGEATTAPADPLAAYRASLMKVIAAGGDDAFLALKQLITLQDYEESLLPKQMSEAEKRSLAASAAATAAAYARLAQEKELFEREFPLKQQEAGRLKGEFARNLATTFAQYAPGSEAATPPAYAEGGPVAGLAAFAGQSYTAPKVQSRQAAYDWALQQAQNIIDQQQQVPQGQG